MKRASDWLDGIEAAASTVYLVVLGLIVGAVFVALFYVVTRWPAGYGLGSQGEGFYLALAFVLVIGWVLAQLSWLLKRRRREAWTFDDGSEIPLPKMEVGESGFSFQWGRPPSRETPSASRTWSWNIPLSSSSTRIFKLDHDALRAARTARVAGASWDDVCRQVNSEWDTMNPLDRALYQRAIEAAVASAHDIDPVDPPDDRR